MERRGFLKLLAAVVVAPVLPMPSATQPVLAEPATAAGMIGFDQIRFKGHPIIWDGHYTPEGEIRWMANMVVMNPKRLRYLEGITS